MRELLVSGCVACALAGCEAVGTTDVTRTLQTTLAATTIGASSASCAALTPSQELASARLVFVGRFAPGRTIRVGQSNILVSPARFHVGRYIKGHGPATLRVVTAVTAAGRVSEDGIEAHPGERWLIYTNSKSEPYDTSICAGSRPVAAGPVRSRSCPTCPRSSMRWPTS
jgi:hypothetical protein